MKFVHAALVVLACSSVLRADPAAAQAAPDATESLFWQSTERLATPEGYRAYLSRYPNGFFAPLANAALNKGSAAAATRQESPAPATLAPFVAAPDSGAVQFNVGDTFDGPMAHTVGWAGAKKQVVLPAGRWIALAAKDEPVSLASSINTITTPQRVVLATAMFGRFVDGRLAALLQFRFSSHKSSSIAWSGVDGCERPGNLALQSFRPQASGWRDECMALAYDPNPLTGTAPADDARRSLTRMGAKVQGPALVSTLSFSEKQRGYLGITRYDWPGVTMGDDAQSQRDWNPVGMDSAHQAYSTQLWAWVKAYQQLARDGYTNDYDGTGKTPSDFSPSPRTR